MPEEMPWEYNFAALDAAFADRDQMLGQLNVYARDGWELVALTQDAGRLVALLKRPARKAWADTTLRAATG